MDPANRPQPDSTPNRPDHSEQHVGESLPDAEIIASLLGEATAEQQARFTAARGDPRVQSREASLAAMLATIREERQLDASFAITPAQRDRLLRILPEAGWSLGTSVASAVATAAGSALREVVSLLTFDSWRDAPGLAGFRSGVTEERLLRFEADGCMVDLRLTPDAIDPARRWMLQCECEGLVLSSGSIARIALDGLTRTSPASPVSCAISGDSYAEASLEAGQYRLELRHRDGTLIIEPLIVGPQPPRNSGTPSDPASR
ncbi:MAG: hypothetical protein MUE97_04745 [Phycisphaerales bacterium]|jgi:hypothetical protein|nr:hypothetical protein [Phycisphaerales bacterium]